MASKRKYNVDFDADLELLIGDFQKTKIEEEKVENELDDLDLLAESMEKLNVIKQVSRKKLDKIKRKLLEKTHHETVDYEIKSVVVENEDLSSIECDLQDIDNYLFVIQNPNQPNLNYCLTKNELANNQKSDSWYFECLNTYTQKTKNNIIYSEFLRINGDRFLIPLYKLLKVLENPVNRIFYLDIQYRLNSMVSFNNSYTGIVGEDTYRCNQQYNYYICDIAINEKPSLMADFFMKYHKAGIYQ